MYRYGILNKISLLSLGLLLGCSLFEDKVKFDKCTLSYGQSTFWRSPTNNNVTARPTAPTTRGVYVADPDSLVLNSHTGEINVSRSLTGKYKIRFISADNNTYCETDIIISGLTYPSGIFALPRSPVAKPYYDYNPDTTNRNEIREQVVRTSVYDTPPQGQTSAFAQGLRLTRDGSIDLKATTATPQVRNSRDTNRPVQIVLYYRLNDRSDSALNVTRLNVYYFSSESNIPRELRDELERQKEYLPKGRRAGMQHDHRPTDVVLID